MKGRKTATASAYDLYAVDGESLPQEGSYDVVLDSQNQAICIIQITKVSVVPFKDVSVEHAFKEGEGERSLAWWQDSHRKFFTQWFKDAALTFNEDSLVVLEEFCCVYPSFNK